MSKSSILLIFCFLSITTPAGSQGVETYYKLILEKNGNPVVGDEFFFPKSPNDPFPKAEIVSFVSDVISLKIEFGFSSKVKENASQYTCNLGMQTESGYERFNFEKHTQLITRGSLHDSDTYRCEFTNITRHVISNDVPRSPIDRDRTYLFEIWVNELGKNGTYLPVVANEDSNWPNESMQPATDVSVD